MSIWTIAAITILLAWCLYTEWRLRKVVELLGMVRNILTDMAKQRGEQ